ncbi:hypothetical protein [Neisseria dumasiana]|uniref:Uncharacterized protein n=1 Tax=Neisseria dumasiana TaxID=1931275 RepID=A0A1X3DL47_9NEIS|nr:hypothetical protein [Neisseria dumasiana]OSI25091.1 hypothetical protein BV912_01570 [Neisseria dumasiana]
MKLVDDLLAAAKNPTTPAGLKLMLSEAAVCIMNLSTQDLYDQCRMGWLEDLGSFLIDKKYGENPVVTVLIQPGQYFAAQAPTVREAVDLAREDYLEMRGLHPRDFGNPFKSGDVERVMETV